MRECVFSLSEEEAMGLLDIILITPVELSLEQRAAVTKLGEACRQFMRENGAVKSIRCAALNPTTEDPYPPMDRIPNPM